MQAPGISDRRIRDLPTVGNTSELEQPASGREWSSKMTEEEEDPEGVKPRSDPSPLTFSLKNGFSLVFMSLKWDSAAS